MEVKTIGLEVGCEKSTGVKDDFNGGRVVIPWDGTSFLMSSG